jgi:hypothetical protein
MNFDKMSSMFSISRMKTYLELGDYNKEIAFKLYCWNIDTSNSLFDIIGILEIALRNAIDIQLTKYNDGKSWITNPNELLQRIVHKPSIETAKERTLISFKMKNILPSHEDYLSQLQFSMWRFFMPEGDKAFAKKLLWEEAIKFSFPNLDKSDNKLLINSIVRIYHLRNRIAHLEPTLKSQKVRNIYNDLVFVAGAISTDLQSWIISRQHITYQLKRKP